MFFPRRSEPLEVEADGLRSLRFSLNAPVIATQDLPVGPARAAIALHPEPDGRPNVTVAVRSLKSGEVVLYSYDGDLQEESSVAVGIDAALSFGESMGFLFDDDELAEAGDPGAASRALGAWRGLVDGEPLEGADVLELSDAGDVLAEDDEDALLTGEDTAPGLDSAAGDDREEAWPRAGEDRGGAWPAAADGREAAWPAAGDDPGTVLDGGAGDGAFLSGDASEVLLEDLAAPGPRAASPAQAPASGAGAETRAPARPAARAASTPVPLSKFRHRAPEALPAAGTGSPGAGRTARAAGASAAAGEAAAPPRSRTRAALGRLRLVKRRLGGQREPGDRRSWVARLLTSF